MSDKQVALGFQKLELNDLPKYTGWPKRLMEASATTLYIKTTKEVYREYEGDKWSALFAQIQQQNLGVDEIEVMQFSSPQNIACSLGDEIYVAPPLATRVVLASIIADKIESVRHKGDPIVELGAGTGAVIIRLTKDQRFADATFHAGDFSPSSIKIIQHLAKAEGVTIDTGIYDFNATQSELIIPPSSVIFISFAMAYMQKTDVVFWERLMQFKPRAILVAEPIYPYFREQTLLGLLRKRYYEANDYNREILSSIQEAQQQGILKIDHVEENVMGINPLCPVSMITIMPMV